MALQQTGTFFGSPVLPLKPLTRASQNVIFIKTHKTASSTVTSIFHNIATSRNKSVLVSTETRARTIYIFVPRTHQPLSRIGRRCRLSYTVPRSLITKTRVEYIRKRGLHRGHAARPTLPIFGSWLDGTFKSVLRCN